MSYLENIRTFVRVYELGSMSAAGRDLRISPAVTSARISALEDHLAVRLFQRTTRSLTPTAQGKAFYGGACSVLDAVDYAEAQVTDLTENPKGLLHVAAPLGVGRRLIGHRCLLVSLMGIRWVNSPEPIAPASTERAPVAVDHSRGRATG